MDYLTLKTSKEGYKHIHSYQGANFEINVIKELHAMTVMGKVKTLNYHTITNGVC
jgi:hypothetical protein